MCAVIKLTYNYIKVKVKNGGIFFFYLASYIILKS